jgi:hypothetical protein
MAKLKQVGSVESFIDEYSTISEQVKLLEARKKKLSDQIKKFATTQGEKDEKGSYYAETSKYVYGSVARKSVNLNQEKALEFLKENGLDACIKVTESVDEEAFSKLIEEQVITTEALEELTTIKVVYAISVQKKEEVTEDVRQFVASFKGKRGVK